MVSYGPTSYNENLMLCFDQQNSKSWNGSIFTDLVTGNNADNIGDPAWLNNIGYTTISMVVNRYQTAGGYADHPISKFNATLQNASMTFYSFQAAGGEGNWNFIAGNGNWTGLGNGGVLTLGTLHHIVLQYNAVDGAQTWFNGSKNGGRGANGILGNSHTAGTSAIGFEGANPNGNGHTKIHHLSWWNRELPDDEIINQYNRLKSAYGVL